jgi:hypothetical protein
VLQVKGAPPKGVNPFAKKKKADEENPDAQAQETPAPGQPGVGPQKQPLDGQEPDEAEIAALEEQPDPEADPEADPNLDPERGSRTPRPTRRRRTRTRPEQQPNDQLDQQDNPEDQADTLNPHEWAGDVYEEGDETDPAQSFAAFQRPDGASAWLDRSDDGTLTGWVTDADGTVYRYSDPNAWAIDVDDAAMAQSHGPQGQQQQDAQTQDQQQPVPGQPARPGRSGPCSTTSRSGRTPPAAGLCLRPPTSPPTCGPSRSRTCKHGPSDRARPGVPRRRPGGRRRHPESVPG